MCLVTSFVIATRNNRWSNAFDEVAAKFAESYADQNESDYEAMKARVESRRIKAAVEA